MTAERPYRLDSCGGMVPTQAEGVTADGRPFYFRARHGEWTLELGQPGWPADYVRWPILELAQQAEWLIAAGDDDTFGSMSRASVVAILDAHLPADAKAGQSAPGGPE